MSAGAESILVELERVEAQRRMRAADPPLARAVEAVKAYQQERFKLTYADLLLSERFGAAARFFLEELYGPGDFSMRDAQFARVVPTLVRIFPQEIVETVETLVRLHALTEELDTLMARHAGAGPLDRLAYQQAWLATGRADDRQRQIELTLAVGDDLDRLTRKPLLRHTLHLMRVPARAAGLGQLQQFLESGFDSFRSMRGARPFLETIGARERALVIALFTETVAEDPARDPRDAGDPLGQLP